MTKPNPSLTQEKKKFAQDASRRSGLPLKVCESLFRAGWSYYEQYGQPPLWVHPSARFGKDRVNRTINYHV